METQSVRNLILTLVLIVLTGAFTALTALAAVYLGPVVAVPLAVLGLVVAAVIGKYAR